MAEIDLLKLQKEANINAIRNLLKDPKFLAGFGLLSFTGTNMIATKNIIIRIINSFTMVTQLYSLNRYWEVECSKEKNKLYELRTQTETYKECKKEYESFISQIATLIKNTGLKNPKELTLYIYMLMRLGFFSNGLNHKYQKFKYDEYSMLELMGTRVLTGASVCRHTTYFMNDVLKEIGITSAAVAARGENNIKKLLSKRKPKTDHLINTIEYEGKVFMFDTTAGCFVTKSTHELFKNKSNVYEPVTGFVPVYYIIDPNYLVFNTAKEQAERLMHLEDEPTTFEEYNDILSKLKSIFEQELNINEEFYEITTPQREKIVTLSKILMPYSDKPITEWKVR